MDMHKRAHGRADVHVHRQTCTQYPLPLGVCVCSLDHQDGKHLAAAMTMGSPKNETIQIVQVYDYFFKVHETSIER